MVIQYEHCQCCDDRSRGLQLIFHDGVVVELPPEDGPQKGCARWKVDELITVGVWV